MDSPSSEKINGIEDMVHLSILSEESILENLKNRYDLNLIYTYVGSILIIVNPYKLLPLYDAATLQAYQSSRINILPPHIYAIANEAHYLMLKTAHDQCVLISGESGAGKTEATKHILQALTALSQSHNWIEEQVLEANAILEAFGNAKTVRNDNSSRFGKFVSTQFNEYGKIVGAKINNYLLEKSRVVTCSSEERSFHVFYQLLAGSSPEEKASLFLKSPQEYRFLSNGSASIPAKDDAKHFKNLKIAMSILGFENENLSEIFSILSGILLLGNVEFDSTVNPDTGIDIITVQRAKDNDTLFQVAQLLQMNADDIAMALTSKTTLTRGEMFTTPLTLQKSKETRDSLAKTLYDSLFKWIVDTVNSHIECAVPANNIGILDIFGFENFPANSFEQFCINFANEQLQQFFNKYIFEVEQKEYEKEGIDWSDIKFNDNEACLALFTKKHVGLLSLLEEESALPTTTDTTLVAKFHHHWEGKSPHYLYVKQQAQSSFGISHYAGEVMYNVSSFLEKNRDSINPDVIAIFWESKSKIVASLFKTPSQPESIGKKMTLKVMKKATHKGTVAGHFKESLDELVLQLEAANPHFIRCIKPNSQKKSDTFDNTLVTTQLRYTGLLETVRIRRAGFPLRLFQTAFIARFYFLAQLKNFDLKTVLANDKENDANKATCLAIFAAFSLPKSGFQVGKTRVFLKSEAISKLEAHRELFLGKKATKIQKIARMFLQRTKFNKTKAATIIIQKHRRKVIARRKFLLQKKSANRIRAFALGCLARMAFKRKRLAAVTIQSAYKRYDAKKITRIRLNFVRKIQSAIRTVLAKSALESCYLNKIQTEEAKRIRLAEAEKARQEVLQRERQAQEELKKAEDRRREEKKMKEQEQALPKDIPLPGGLHVKRSSMQRHLNAFDIKQAELNPEWLLSLKSSMIPLSGKPVLVTFPSEEIKEAKKRDLAGFTFAKFAATFFQARQIATYSADLITTSLLMLSNKELMLEAVESYALITAFLDTGVDDSSFSDMYMKDKVDDLIFKGVFNEAMRDEIYCQLCKQTNGNMNMTSATRGWYLLSLCLGCFPPSEKFEKYLENYILSGMNANFSAYCWNRLQKICSTRSITCRTASPSGLELSAASDQVLIPITVTSEDGKKAEVLIDSSTLVSDVIEAASKKLNLVHRTGFSLYKNGRCPISPQIFFFDFLASVGGETTLIADAKTKPREDGLSKYIFQLKKQYFEPGELLEDPVAIENVYRQIINSVASGHAACGFEGAITALSAFLFVSNDGKVPPDFAKKLAKSEKKDEIFLGVAKKFNDLLKGQKNMTSTENLAEMVEQQLKRSKWTTVKEAKLGLIYVVRKSWTHQFGRVIPAKRVIEGKAPIPVSVILGEYEITLIEGSESAESGGVTSFEYLEILAMSHNKENLRIHLTDKAYTLLLSIGELAFQFIKTHMIKMQENSFHAIAMSNYFHGSDDTEVLGFKKEDYIIVSSKSDPIWWKGSLPSDPSRVAAFPKDSVHLLCGPLKTLESAMFQISLTSERGILTEPGVISTVSHFRRDRHDLSLDLSNVEDESSSLDLYVNEFLRVDVPAVMGKISLRGTFTGTMKGGLKGTVLRARANSIKDPALSSSSSSSLFEKSKAFFYTKEPISEALHYDLKTEDDKKLSLHAFSSLQKIMGDYPSKKPLLELIQGLVDLALTSSKEIWRDELYIHVIRQLTQNKHKSGVRRAWELMCIYCSFFLPSLRLDPVLVQFIDKNTKSKYDTISKYADFCKSALIQVRVNGQRKSPPTQLEVEAIQQLRPLMIKIYFPSGFSPEYRTISASSSTTAHEALKALLPKLGLEKKNFYALYKVLSNGEFFSIPDSTFLTDALWEIEDEVAKNKDYQGLTYRIEFRKRVWLQQSEDESGLNVEYLIFTQSLTWLRAGFFDFDLEELMSLAALQHRFFYQETLPKDLLAQIKTYITITKDMKFGKGELEKQFTKSHNYYQGMTKDEVVLAFNNILRESHLYGTQYFQASQSFDATFPNRILIGVSRECISIVNPLTKAVLQTFRYNEIGYWSSNKSNFVMKVGNMADESRFVCETRHGKDVTDLLENYVAAAVDKKKAGQRRQSLNTARRLQHQFLHRGNSTSNLLKVQTAPSGTKRPPIPGKDPESPKSPLSASPMSPGSD